MSLPDRLALRYVIKPHTNSSQLVEGQYAEDMTKADVEKEVQGTWGGRFDLFENGHFRYIAYTD